MLNLERSGDPEVHMDVPAVVSQFLSELTTFDLVVELVQNDLDAGATRTDITFDSNQLVCSGNGKKIDRAGWKRLRYVLGAGTEVDAKQNGIGSKNHGLRSAFLFGDQIVVQSGGFRIDLTVRGNKLKPDFLFPAVWPETSDPDAPETGTRITVPYRTQPLNVPERNPLEPIDGIELEKLFADAVDRSADRFLCASAPGRKWSYQLHLSKGTRSVSFYFDSFPLKQPIGCFLRTCKKSVDITPSRIVERRISSPFELRLLDNDNAKIPQLFRRGNKVFGELSWRVKKNLKPEAGPGGLRYPIAYPREHLSKGWGFDISGPFISARARHSISDEPRNKLILECGLKAFVQRMARDLISLYGPEALELATNLERSDHADESLLASELFKAGAVPIFVLQANKKTAAKKFVKADPQATIFLPIPTYASGKLSKSIASVSASQGQTLHPSVPESFVNVIPRLPMLQRPNVKKFSELDGATLTFLHADSWSPPNFDRWLAQCVTITKELELSRINKMLPSDFLKNLKEKGLLPTIDRSVTSWLLARRSVKRPPKVPGVSGPPLLHPSLQNFSILKSGGGKVETFRIDDHLSNLDFSQADAESRLDFFYWLKSGYRELTPKTLIKVANYPIWPATDGSYKPLTYFCRPKAAYLQKVLEETRSQATEAVYSFPGIRYNSNASLNLRRVPSGEEIWDWHARRMKLAEEAEGTKSSVDLETIINDTEELLTKLLSDGLLPSTLAGAHKSISLAGNLVPTQIIHVQTPRVVQCELNPTDVAAGHHVALYKHFGSLVSPSRAAILRAFKISPTPSSLIPRLEAYKVVGGDLGELSAEKIVHVGDKLLAPETLCFPSTTNWWGDWKIPIENVPDIPEHVALLQSVGIVRAQLREDLSRAFFEWLNAQPQHILQKHKQQIVRHWADRRAGPVRWIEHAPQVKCIPVHDKNSGFELLSRNQATGARTTVFVPDFDSLAHKIIETKSRVRFTITDARGVDGSIIEQLNLVGVSSLRESAGRAVGLMTGTDTRPDLELDQELARLKSRDLLGTLRRRLSYHGVPGSALRYNWRRLASALSGVRIASDLTAVYRVLGHDYEVAVDSGVDEPTHQICISGQTDHRIGFYAALADYLFEAGSNRLFAFGLMQAIHSGLPRELFGSGGVDNDESDEADTPHVDLSDGNDGEAARKAHGVSRVESVMAVPSPAFIHPIKSPTYSNVNRGKSVTKVSTSNTDDRRHSIEEDEQILALKAGHYAWHCQACLGERDVSALTPPRSYVYLSTYRKGLIEAHHVQHLQNKGEVGASNLIILCKFHHQTFGDVFSRSVILAALQGAKPTLRNFPVDLEGTELKHTEGMIAAVKLSTHPFVVNLFFTKPHAEAWKLA